MQKQVEKKKYYVVRERAVPEVLLKDQPQLFLQI